MKVYDSELKILNILWNKGDTSAKDLAKILHEKIGWNKTTTYTVIKKCIDKGAIKKIDPDFICQAIISKEQIQEYETKELIDKMYDGINDLLIANLLGHQKMTIEELEQIKKLVKEFKE